MRTLALVAMLSATPLIAAAAQSCVGIPNASRGFLAYGLSGTDGAVGEVLAFGYRGSRASILLNRISLSAFTYVDRLNTSVAHIAVPVRRSAFCLTSGLELTGYDTEQEQWEGWDSTDPDFINERHLRGGAYHMVSLPILAQAGSAHRLLGLGIQPFAAAGPVLQWEQYTPEGGAMQKRSQVATRLGVGVTLTANWLVIRSTVTNASAPSRTLAGRNNFAAFHLKAGVRF